MSLPKIFITALILGVVFVVGVILLNQGNVTEESTQQALELGGPLSEKETAVAGEKDLKSTLAELGLLDGEEEILSQCDNCPYPEWVVANSAVTKYVYATGTMITLRNNTSNGWLEVREVLKANDWVGYGEDFFTGFIPVTASGPMGETEAFRHRTDTAEDAQILVLESQLFFSDDDVYNRELLYTTLTLFLSEPMNLYESLD